VRHGETAWNREKIFRGRMDVALDELGIRQAEALARYLSEQNLQAIYSSPLKRAFETANRIARYQQVPVQAVEGLIDIDYGEWQSLSEQEVKRRYPALYEEWCNNPHRVTIPGGENLEDVKERAVRVVNEAVSKHQGNVVLVSHRVVNKVLICFLLGLDNSHFWNIRQDVCGVTIFEHRHGRFILTRHNDTSHLRGLQGALRDDF
jgi:broad specificity phosphatase PhoE